MTSGRAVLARLVGISAPPWGRLVAAFALGLGGAAATIGLMAGSGYVVGRAALRPGLGAIAGVLALVEVMAFVRAPLRYGERLVVHDAALRALAGWRVWLYDRLEPLSPAGLAGLRSGDLLTRAVDDVDSLQDLYVRGLVPAAVAVGAGVLGTVVVAVVLPAAGAVLGVCLLAALTLGPLAALGARRVAPAELELRAALAADTVDLLRGAPDLLAFGADAALVARVERADRAVAAGERRRAWWAGAASGVVTLAVGAAVVGTLALAVDALAHHHLDAVMVAVLPLAALGAFEPVPPVLAAALHGAEVTAAGRRLLALEVPPPVRDPASPLPPPAGCPEIAFEDATLRYHPGLPPALDGVDLALAPGSRTVVTGASGSGKTSLIHALLRFWPLESGRVRAGAVDLDRLAQADARRLVALGDQHARVFSWSLRRNLVLGRPGATDAEVARAVRLAQLDDLVDTLPRGLDTPLGEEGAQVSGGERRRIALARALLAERPVLVLDEPTAGLDADTAARVWAGLLADADGGTPRTLLVATHQRTGLESLPAVVLESGRVVERRPPAGA